MLCARSTFRRGAREAQAVARRALQLDEGLLHAARVGEHPHARRIGYGNGGVLPVGGGRLARAPCF
eukprot:261330-Prymnesium_polylepis.2